jgi:hypothetical protein
MNDNTKNNDNYKFSMKKFLSGSECLPASLIGFRKNQKGVDMVSNSDCESKNAIVGTTESLSLLPSVSSSVEDGLESGLKSGFVSSGYECERTGHPSHSSKGYLISFIDSSLFESRLSEWHSYQKYHHEIYFNQGRNKDGMIWDGNCRNPFLDADELLPTLGWGRQISGENQEQKIDDDIRQPLSCDICDDGSGRKIPSSLQWGIMPVIATPRENSYQMFTDNDEYLYQALIYYHGNQILPLPILISPVQTVNPIRP